MLTREQILNANDLPSEPVPVPEWGQGATLKVRQLTVAEVNELAKKQTEHPDKVFAYWLVFTVVDDNGNRLFTPEDAVALEGKSAQVIKRLAEAAIKLNMFNTEAAAKNS
jgi:hypothetical protein